MTRVTVVVASHNEPRLRRTVRDLLRTLPPDGEVVVVDDGSTDGCATGFDGDGRLRVVRTGRRIGAPAARNLGAEEARGDVLVFSDAHVSAPVGWTGPILDVLERPEVGAVNPTYVEMSDPDQKGYGLRFIDVELNWEWLDLQEAVPYPVPLLGGFFLAIRRDVFDETGGFDSGIATWGGEDAELSFRLWTLGYLCLVVPEVEVAHLSHAAEACPPYQLDWENWIYNTLRLVVVHFGEARICRYLESCAGNSAFPAAFRRLVESDAWARRRRVHAARRYDDTWYFAKFGDVA